MACPFVVSVRLRRHDRHRR